MTPPRPRAEVRVVTDGPALAAGQSQGQVQIEGVDGLVEVARLEGDTYQVTIDGRRFEVSVASGPDAEWGWVAGHTFRWPHRPEIDRGAETSEDAPITATMPATVSRVAVTDGQRVSRGDTLVVLEAMKMEIPLRAPRDGRVTAIRCAEGDTVEPGLVLVDLD